jgi:hypothetical protein
VQVDSAALLAAYHASAVPQPGATYRLLLGDLYRLEFDRAQALQQYAPPGRSRLRGEPIAYAEAESAAQLQLWSVAALCRCVCLCCVRGCAVGCDAAALQCIARHARRHQCRRRCRCCHMTQVPVC